MMTEAEKRALAKQEHIDHNKPLVYETENLKSGDVLVHDTHEAALRQVQRHPKGEVILTARNARI